MRACFRCLNLGIALPNSGTTYDVPDDVFMALELVDGALQGTSGVVHYDPVFGDTL